MKGILSEHTEQAPIFIKNSFQTTALDMDSIPWEKAQLTAEEKPHCVLGEKNGTWMDFMLTYNFHEFAMNFHSIFL